MNFTIFNYKVQFRVFDLQTVARIVRAGEASSEAERRNEGSTKCVRNPKKREFALQTRDEKCYAFLAFFAKQKATLKIKIRNLTFVLVVKILKTGIKIVGLLKSFYKHAVTIREKSVFVLNSDIISI